MNMATDKPSGRDRLHGRKTLQVTSFLDEFEKDDIKKYVDIVDLFSHFGITLTKKGKSYMAKCPWHNDSNPSLSVDREKDNGVYHCFGCGESGDIFTLTEKMKGCNFKEAAKYLKGFKGSPLPKASVDMKTDKGNGNDEGNTPDDGDNSSPLAASVAARQPKEKQKDEDAADDAEPGSVPDDDITLATIADYYHKKLYEKPEAIEYLKKRGLANHENYDRFQIGFSDGGLLEITGESQRRTLKELCILREKGAEHFKNCVTFPIIDELGVVVGMYGRSIVPDAKVKHLYFKGKHKGVFHRKASKVFDEIILTESIIDALSLIELGIENVQAVYGTNGFTDEHLRILKDDRVKTVMLAFDSDEAGKSASGKLSERLLAEGFTVKTITPPAVPNLFPDNPETAPKDWSEYLAAGGCADTVKEAIAQSETRKAESPSSGDGSSSGMAVEKTPLGYDFTLTSTSASIASGVIYRLTNVKEMFVGNLRVNIRAELIGNPDAEKFYDHVDLYSSRSRAACSTNISRIFSIEPRLIEKDIIRILEYLEAERDRRLAVGVREKGHDMTAEETALGMELLSDPHVFDRFLKAMETLGYVGETVNKLLMFIAACSRKMDDPISVMVISQSSGGKTKLVETVESLISPEDVISVTSLSDQALNYVSDMEHKFLVLGEAVHGIEVEHQLREIQSSRKLTRGVTVKDFSAPTLRRTRIKASARSPITAFFRWVNDRGLDFLCLRIAEAQEFQLHLATKTDEDGSVHYSRVTVSTMVDRVRRFYDYLRKKKLIHSNPFNEIQAIKRKKAIPKNILNEEQMSLFLRHFREFHKAGNLIDRRKIYRAHVLAEFMYSTGARINEVMKITREDIDFPRNTVTVHDDKTDKSRECILNEYAAKVLRLFTDEMRQYTLVENIKRGDSLFGAGGSLVIWFNGALTEESAKLGLPKVTTHHFRHAVGFHLLRAGCDIRYIKEILGHEELGTTQIYTKVDKLDLKSVIDEFHPRKMRPPLSSGHLPLVKGESESGS